MKRDWVCDCCGSRYGTKNTLREHMKIHLPPSFACSKCDRKFAYAHHLKRHAGILNEFCKICNKGYSTKESLKKHIIQKHFSSKIHCEIPNCSYKTGVKSYYKLHLEKMHRKIDQQLIKKMLHDLQKLKPDYEKLKYV